MHKFFIVKRLGLTMLLSALITMAIAQPVRDSSRTTPGGSRPSAGPRPYKEVITDKAKTDEGLFSVHWLEDKYFF